MGFDEIFFIGKNKVVFLVLVFFYEIMMFFFVSKREEMELGRYCVVYKWINVWEGDKW